MSNDKLSLAERREALIVECSMQRRDAAREIAALMSQRGSGVGGVLGGGFKLPLTIASTVIGLIAAKSGRVLPALTIGLSLMKVARGAISMFRRK